MPKSILPHAVDGLLALLISSAFAAAIEAAEAAPRDAPRARPNVVLVLTDDQGYGDLSCHGNPVLKTPYLDKLHDESVRLTDFHVTPMCTPTRGELMTGRCALVNGAYCVSSGRSFVRPEMVTMPQLFKAAGYSTAMFGKWHLGDNYPHRPIDRGFDEAVYHLGWGITSTPDAWNGDYFDDVFRHNGVPQQYHGYCTDVFFAQATAWIQQMAKQKQPFFAYIATNAPHGPFYAPAEYRAKYKSLDHETAGFFGMIANIDDNLERFDEQLQRFGLRENTLFIFLTDNGGTGGIKVYNAGMRGAKGSLYEGGHRVPCFLRWPAGKLGAPRNIDALTNVKDLLPTLIELCRLPNPARANFDGVSLVPLLRGEPRAGYEAIDQRTLMIQFGGLVEATPTRGDAAVLRGKWRLVGGKELYNIAVDPGQQSDLARANPEIVKDLRAWYEGWWDNAVAPRLHDAVTITIGAEAENPTTLSSLDWWANRLTPAAQPFDIRMLGEAHVVEGSLPGGRPQPQMIGGWRIEVARDGEYEIALRRWPKDAAAAIRAPLPPYKGVDGDFPAGKALDATTARLRVACAAKGDYLLEPEVFSQTLFDATRPIGEEDPSVTFNVALKAGPAELATWFYGADGAPLCSAFYVEVRRK